MKKSILVPVIALFLFSCDSKKEEPAVATAPEKTVTEEAPTAPKITMPYTASYSSDWKIGNPENTKIVLDLYKAIEDNKIDEFNKYLADTVTIAGYDNVNFTGSKAEAIKRTKKFRNTLSSLSEEFLAFVPLHSNDKNEEWVATWMKEKVVRKDGSKDSTTYMETWRFRDGKIYHKGGFARYTPE